jgi:zinc protease
MSIGVGVRTLKPRRPGPRTALALAAVLLAMAPAEAEAQADLLPRDPNVTTGRLDNGFSYYIRHNERPQDRAELRLVVNVGSLLEDPDQLGLAHFAEHMAFNGTARFPRQAIVDYLERIGVRFGADLNAATSFDYTIYMLTVPTDRAGVLETAFDIMEDWAMAVTFDSLEIERERGVVMEEWRAGRGAGARIADRQFPILLQGSRYAARLPIGSPASLQAFEHHALRRFYRDWYRPDLMALVAVGDFDPSQVESLITSRFSGMTPPAADARERIAYDVPPHQEPRYAPATDPEEIGSTIAVYFKGPARDASTVGSYRRSIVEQLFSSMINDRLFEIQQQPDAPFLYASVAQGRFVRPLDMWLLVAGVPDSGGAPVRGLESILTEAARVVRFGFTASELDRHKRLFEREMERVFDERDKTNSSQYAGEYVRHFLDGEPYPGIATEFRLHRELLPGIALDEVDAVAQQLFQDSNRVVLFSGPGTVEPPAEPVLMQLFESVGERELVAYEDRAGDLAIVPDPPKPGTVVAERRVASLDVTEWRLSNGVRVLLKATDFRDDEVVFRAMSPGGTSLVEDEDYVPASTATAVVTAGGVGELDLVALQKTLAGKIVSVFPESMESRRACPVAPRQKICRPCSN